MSLSSVDRLFQMTAADTANALAPMTVLVLLFVVLTVSLCQPSYCRDQDAIICQIQRGKTVKALEDDHDITTAV